MNQINSILKKFGLTETEIKIYLTGLSFSSFTISELVKQTNIKRTTIYHAIETLMQKGLCAKKETPNKQAFSVTDPKNIEKLLDEKIAAMEKQKADFHSILPLLAPLTKKETSKMKVLHYVGIEGIKLVIEDALYCKSNHWDIIAPVKNFFSEFDKNYAAYFVETRKKRGLTARSLWETSDTHKYITKGALLQRNPRILPKVMHEKFKSVICLYDDKVLVISSLEELSAILIQSKEFNETMSAIYDGLWGSSKPIND
ncbi:MAG: helix-turn-helix domain-containing protein [Patescibacteria group bacterium]